MLKEAKTRAPHFNNNKYSHLYFIRVSSDVIKSYCDIKIITAGETKISVKVCHCKGLGRERVQRCRI